MLKFSLFKITLSILESTLEKYPAPIHIPPKSTSNIVTKTAFSYLFFS